MIDLNRVKGLSFMRSLFPDFSILATVHRTIPDKNTCQSVKFLLLRYYFQVLLELSDAELEAGLGVTHPLHRKKLRLAIEEHRHPSHVRYPCIAQLGHTWVSSEWLPDLGLAQYSESFATNMVDARMLDHLSKKELEKLLGVTRKFHQASIVHGIHLLRMLNYDRQVSEFALSAEITRSCRVRQEYVMIQVD